MDKGPNAAPFLPSPSHAGVVVEKGTKLFNIRPIMGYLEEILAVSPTDHPASVGAKFPGRTCFGPR